MTAPILPWPHGTRTGYVNHGCRCEHCREADRRYKQESRARHKEKGLPPGDARHGTTNGYSNYGCRCTDCREAFRLDQRARRGTR